LAAGVTREEAPSTEIRRSRRNPVRWVALGVATGVAVLAVTMALVLGTDPRADQLRSRLVGHAAPTFDLPALGGHRVSSASLAGKAVIVNFWNTWCIPCREEHPALVAFYQRHVQDPDFAMVGIVRDDTDAAVRAYVRVEGIKWIIALDPSSKAALDFATRGQPETFAISPDGVIAGARIGPSSVADLEVMLAAARGGATPSTTRP